MIMRREAERPAGPISEKSSGAPSASRLLAETASSLPPPPAERNASPPALAPTVVEWMPVVSGPRAIAPHEQLVPAAAPLSPPAASGAGAGAAAEPMSGIVPRGEDPLASVRLHEGALVDRTYRVERSLGVGGMGVVALARDERLDRRVAIKFIKPDLFAFPEMRSFFHNEARAMARVSHPNVLQVYSFGEHEGTPYFVMEYVEGKTVDHWLRARRPGELTDLDEAVNILDQACLGVEAIHTTNTVHRDLKPSNLLMDNQGRVMVGDLGVARILETAHSGSFIVGSASYMAPEAALGEDEAPELASRRDIYALGCIAYELITGRPPFVGQTDMNVLSQHVLQDPMPPSKLRPGLPDVFDDVIGKALAKDPHKRYETIRAFRRALIAAHQGTREPERILVADDDPDWRSIICAALSERFPDAIIDQEADGEAALLAYEKNPYSVVLVDLQMPEMDGAKLTLLLRSMDASQRTPIIVLTAAGGPREWQRLSAIGADAFLVKPVNADDVELVIRRTLRSRNGPPSSRPSQAAAPVSPQAASSTK